MQVFKACSNARALNHDVLLVKIQENSGRPTIWGRQSENSASYANSTVRYVSSSGRYSRVYPYSSGGYSSSSFTVDSVLLVK
jgi:hypothetical protein